jgi:hypothetical protein
LVYVKKKCLVNIYKYIFNIRENYDFHNAITPKWVTVFT